MGPLSMSSTFIKCHRRLHSHAVSPCSEIDCSFFLVTVDLWSADGKHEMNLVLHPTSADRYVPANTPKGKRRGTVTANTSSNQRSSRQSPERSAPTPNAAQYPQVCCFDRYVSASR